MEERTYKHILFAVEDGVATITLKWKLRASADLPDWPED